MADKTAREHFETLPTLIEVRAVNEARNLQMEYGCLSEALRHLTDNETYSGTNFWRFIYNGVKAMEILKEQELKNKDTENALAKMNQDFIKQNFKDGELI